MKYNKSQFPIIVFSDNSTGFFAFLIRWRTKGMYNHVMTMIGGNSVASQGLSTFKLMPLEEYKIRGNRLKFVGVKLSQDGKKAVLDSINMKLEKSKIKKRYDYLGIVGQALGLRWLNNPWTDICSEDVVNHLKQAIPHEDEKTKKALESIYNHGSPEDLNAKMKEHKDVFYVIDRWQWD